MQRFCQLINCFSRAFFQTRFPAANIVDRCIGQVANFKTNSKIPIEKIPVAINTKLKKTIRIINAEEVEERFHSRLSCKRKTYRYVINNSEFSSALYRNLECHIPQKLDLEKMKEACKYFIGTHDFRSFVSKKSGKNDFVRTIYDAKIIELFDGLYAFEITGNGFLYNMVRIIFGTILKVGYGQIKPQDVQSILEGKSRVLAGKTMPANALVMKKVEY